MFLAEQGVRGARFWENIILYNPEQKRFDYLKGSRQVCAPWFDSIKKRVIGVYTFGSQHLISDYKIINDSLIETSRELWQDDTLMKKIK